MIVYTHKNPQTKEVFYIGIGISEYRAYKFKDKARNKFWHNYVNKYGQPIVEIIARFDNRQDAVNLEMELIAKYKRISDGGSLVNLTIGGDGGALGMKWDKEIIEKRISKIRGKTHTEQSKRNMRDAQNRPEVKAKHEAYKKDPKWLELQRNAKLGRKLTDEHRSKISQGNKGRVNSEESKKKISIANKGKIRTFEQRLKVSIAKKGIKLTESHRLNSANGHKKIILNAETGIYYKGVQDAANSIGMNINTLRSKLTGHIRNNTPFIYA